MPPITPISEHAISVVFASDENYVPYLSVALQSLIESASTDHLYDIIILSNGIGGTSKESISRQVYDMPHISIRIVEVDSFVQQYQLNSLFTSHHISISSYLRLLIGKICADYKKIIYLDCDLIINRDIAALYQISTGAHTIAAALDMTIAYSYQSKVPKWEEFRQYMEDTFHYTAIKSYFNAGVLIIDIKKFKAIDLNDMLSIAKTINRFFHDQDVLNVLFENNFMHLPPTWNAQWHTAFNIKENEAYISSEEREVYKNTNMLPAILHYTSRKKPWNTPYMRSWGKAWWRYARRSPFYTQIIRNFLEKKFTLFLNYHLYAIASKISFGKMHQRHCQKKDMYRLLLNEVRYYVSLSAE